MPEADQVPLYTAAEVREMDRLAIDAAGISGYALMCRAGQALANFIKTEWPNAQQVCVLCGPGNNGGDGYVVARLMRERGCAVTVITLCEPGQLRGDAKQAADDFVGAGGGIEGFSGALPATADLVVDALLGTGLARAVEGDYLRAIAALNAHDAPVLSVDIPSGLHADTGNELGLAVEADATLTFIGRKRGLYTAAGVHCCGRVAFDALDVPEPISRHPATTRLVTRPPLGSLSRPRRRDAHKGVFGHVLVVGGRPGMSGATRLSAEAAARSGAGLVSVATHPQHASCLNAGRPELMVHAIDDSRQLAPLLQRATVVAIGPGLGQSEWSRSLLESVLQSTLPLVVDADALNLLAADPVERGDWVLTPHPGEAGRLLGSSSRDVQQDRFAAVRAIQAQYGGVALLKGPGSLVAADSESCVLCAGGNPGMASGGMGDVLSGVIAALLAQGLTAGEAAIAGVSLHARAADRLAGRQGERGLLASDLFTPIREQLNDRR